MWNINFSVWMKVKGTHIVISVDYDVSYVESVEEDALVVKIVQHVVHNYIAPCELWLADDPWPRIGYRDTEFE